MPKTKTDAAIIMASTSVRQVPNESGVYLLRIWATMSVPPVFAPPFMTKPIPAPMVTPPNSALSQMLSGSE